MAEDKNQTAEGAHEYVRVEERPDGSRWGLDPRREWVQIYPPGTYFDHVRSLAGSIVSLLASGRTDPEAERTGQTLRAELERSPHQDKVRARIREASDRLAAKGAITRKIRAQLENWSEQ